MVLSDIKRLGERGGANVHKKRFSDRNLFWLLILTAVFLAHYYLYLTVGRYLPPPLETLWLAIGLTAMLSSAAARRLGAPRNGTGKISVRSVFHRFGACWNILVVLTTAFMLFFHLLRSFAPLSPGTSFVTSLLLALLACAYGVMEARNIRSIRFALETEKLCSGRKLRIVQLSDLHISPFMNVGHIARIVRATLIARPDVVVITGDLVDGVVGDDETILPFYRPFEAAMHQIAESTPPLGIWAIPGNHDYYEGFDNSLLFMRNAGIHVLISEVEDLGELVLVGADDLDHQRPALDGRGGEDRTRSVELIDSLTEEQRGKFILLLRHRPVVEPATLGRFDLQLSGHTHGGQVFTLPSSRHRIPGKPKGLLELDGDSKLYVSNGAGFVGPPMRFFAPAEIVVIDLIGTKED